MHTSRTTSGWADYAHAGSGRSMRRQLLHGARPRLPPLHPRSLHMLLLFMESALASAKLDRRFEKLPFTSCPVDSAPRVLEPMGNPPSHVSTPRVKPLAGDVAAFLRVEKGGLMGVGSTACRV